MRKLVLLSSLLLSVPMQGATPRALVGMQQCLVHLKAGNAQSALLTLQAMRDELVFEEHEAEAAHLIAIAQEMIALQADKLSTWLQSGLAECIGMLNAIELETSAFSQLALARATHIIRLALSILVMNALENISLHIPQG